MLVYSHHYCVCTQYVMSDSPVRFIDSAMNPPSAPSRPRRRRKNNNHNSTTVVRVLNFDDVTEATEMMISGTACAA